jgi:hypothetical protein
MGEQPTKPTVYIETTVVSYLTAWPSNNVIRAAQQQITHDWWQSQRSRFDLVASELVILEASSGDPSAAKDRLDVLSHLKIVKSSREAQTLATALITQVALPRIAFRDAFHLAIAATNGIDILLTWNCTHLANMALRSKIDQVCAAAGYRPPTIGTPEQLFSEATNGSGN